MCSESSLPSFRVATVPSGLITIPLSITWLFGVGAARQAKIIKTDACVRLVIGAVVPTLPETEVSENRGRVGSADDRATFADAVPSDGKIIQRAAVAGVVTRKTPWFQKKTGGVPNELQRRTLVSHTAETGSLRRWHLTRSGPPSVPKTKLAMESIEGLRC